MKKGTKVFPFELIKHYSHVDSFMSKYFKTFWQADLIALSEFETVVADRLMDGIVSGRVSIPEYMPVVKVLCLDPSAKHISYSTTVDRKRKSNDDIISGEDMRKKKTLKNERKDQTQADDKASSMEDMLTNTLLAIKSSVDFLQTKQMETELALKEMNGRISGSQASFLSQPQIFTPPMFSQEFRSFETPNQKPRQLILLTLCKEIWIFLEERCLLALKALYPQ